VAPSLGLGVLGELGPRVQDHVVVQDEHVAPLEVERDPVLRRPGDLVEQIERRELDGTCGWNWSSAKSQKPDWVRDNKLNYLAQISLQPNAELTQLGAPEIWRYIKDADDRKVAELVVSQQSFERPYFMAQGTPPELTEILRTAFDATMRDPQFVADAQKSGIDIAGWPVALKIGVNGTNWAARKMPCIGLSGVGSKLPSVGGGSASVGESHTS